MQPPQISRDSLEKIKKTFIYTFVLGFIAYGYVMTNYTPSHDGNMLFKTGQNWELSVGRFGITYYGVIRGIVEAPWLIGILSLTYMALSVYLTMDLLEIRFDSWKLFVISSVFILNAAFICNAAIYIYCWDVYALALLLAVLSVHSAIKINNKLLGFIISILMLALSLGFYQSYLGVSVGLYMLYVCKIILDGKDFKTIILQSCIYIVFLLCSGGLYYLLVKLIQRINGVDPYTGAAQSLDKIQTLGISGILSSVPLSFKQVLHYYFKSNYYVSESVKYANMLILLISICTWAYLWIKRIHAICAKVLIILLILIFPIGINCISVLSGGRHYRLMIFPYQMLYLLMLYPIFYLIPEINTKKLCIKTSVPVTLIMAFISFCIIRYANDVFYFQKWVGEGTRAQIMNIIYDIDRNPNFIEGDTPVVTIGDISLALAGSYAYSDIYTKSSGFVEGTTVTYDANFEWNTKYMYGKNYNFTDDPDIISSIEDNPEVEAMPTYPTAGYCDIIDGVMVIKFK